MDIFNEPKQLTVFDDPLLRTHIRSITTIYKDAGQLPPEWPHITDKEHPADFFYRLSVDLPNQFVCNDDLSPPDLAKRFRVYELIALIYCDLGHQRYSRDKIDRLMADLDKYLFTAFDTPLLRMHIWSLTTIFMDADRLPSDWPYLMDKEHPATYFYRLSSRFYNAGRRHDADATISSPDVEGSKASVLILSIFFNVKRRRYFDIGQIDHLIVDLEKYA